MCNGNRRLPPGASQPARPGSSGGTQCTCYIAAPIRSFGFARDQNEKRLPKEPSGSGTMPGQLRNSGGATTVVGKAPLKAAAPLKAGKLRVPPVPLLEKLTVAVRPSDSVICAPV
jgi:hypothetical protein